MFILFRQDPFSDGLMGLRVYFDGSGGIGNGSAGSAKQKALRRSVGGGEKSARIYAKSGMAHIYKY